MLSIKQIKFAEAEYSKKRQQMHKELFLRMKRVVLWKDLIVPHYSHEKVSVLLLSIADHVAGASDAEPGLATVILRWRRRCAGLRFCASYLEFMVSSV